MCERHIISKFKHLSLSLSFSFQISFVMLSHSYTKRRKRKKEAKGESNARNVYTHIKFIRRKSNKNCLRVERREEVRRHKGGEYSTEMNIKIHPIANILMEVVVGVTLSLSLSSSWGETHLKRVCVCLYMKRKRVALMMSCAKVESK